MAKSKRAKVVTLSKVTKKGKAKKETAIDSIRKWLGSYSVCHVVKIENGQSQLLQNIRDELKSSRLFAGKNRVVQVALGTDPASSAKGQVYKLSALLTGSAALLFTNDSRETLEDQLKGHDQSVWAKTGEIAPETIIIPTGSEAWEGKPSSMEPLLRGLGLPTSLQDGRILMVGEFTVCTKGEPLTKNSAKILKHLGRQFGTFSVRIVGTYSSQEDEIYVTEHAR